MKTIAFTLATLVSMSAFAISNSTLDKRHQAVIKKAVSEKCSFRRGSLEELNVVATPNRVDQGILDFEYVITLKGIDNVDQGVRDEYLVTVESSYSDGYDHTDREWGSYYVNSVKCELL